MCSGSAIDRARSAEHSLQTVASCLVICSLAVPLLSVPVQPPDFGIALRWPEVPVALWEGGM